MTNSLPWKDPPFLSSVNHLFLWAIYTMTFLCRAVEILEFSTLRGHRGHVGADTCIDHLLEAQLPCSASGLGDSQEWLKLAKIVP